MNHKAFTLLVALLLHLERHKERGGQRHVTVAVSVTRPSGRGAPSRMCMPCLEMLAKGKSASSGLNAAGRRRDPGGILEVVLMTRVSFRKLKAR